MSLRYHFAEKEALLPVATVSAASKADEHAINKLESTLFYLCVATLFFLFGCLYFRDSMPPRSPFASTLQLLNAGMLSSLWASLPAPMMMFVGAPYFAERSKVTVVRYWIYLLYTVGVAVGALVFGGEVRAMQCKLAKH